MQHAKKRPDASSHEDVIPSDCETSTMSKVHQAVFDPSSQTTPTVPKYRRWLFRGMAHCPLLLLHMVGGTLGLMAFICRSKSRRGALNFAHKANLPFPFLSVLRSYIDFGRAVFEAPWIWLNPPEKTLKKFRVHMHPTLVSHIKTSKKPKNPILFITSHLGCSEASIVFLAEHFQCRILYQKQKNPWMLAIRSLHHPKHHADFFAMNTTGIRHLLRYLHHGGSVAISIDQTPFEGSGEWLPFFDHPAYTMMLAPKISCMASVSTFCVLYVRRWGGFSISLMPMNDLPSNPIARAATFNRTLEHLIRQYPHQYRWAYDRYRHRKRPQHNTHV